MDLLHKVMSVLMDRVESKRARRPRPARGRLGSLVEQLETRAMLSQVNLGATIVVPPPSAGRPPVILSTRAPFFNRDASVPVRAAGGSGPLDNIEANGQIGVQLVDLDNIETNGQIGVQLVDLDNIETNGQIGVQLVDR